MRVLIENSLLPLRCRADEICGWKEHSAISCSSGSSPSTARLTQMENEQAAVLAGSRYGGTRIVDMLVGDPLPRIC